MPTLFHRDNGKYYFIAQVNGKAKWISLRTSDRKIARERYAEKADQYDRGLLDLKQRKPIPTFSQLFAEYLPFCKAHKAPRTYRDAESHIRLFLDPYFGQMRVMNLEPGEVEKFTGRMITLGYHPRTINLRLETLRKILRRAVENKVISEMPCKIKKLKEPDSLPRYAYPDQIKDWMGYLDISHRLRAVLSLMTGITDRDLGYVMVDGYDAHNALLRFRRPKTTTDIVVPLTKTAVQILDYLVTDNPGPELFPSASAKRAFYEASKKTIEAGGKNITPHMLRHTFGTWMLSMGVPLSHLKEIYGHKDIKTTERYAKVMPEYLRASMANIESKEFDLRALLDIPRKGDGRKDGKRWEHKKIVSKTLANKKGRSS